MTKSKRSKNPNPIKKKINKMKFGLKQIIIEIASGMLTTFILMWLTDQGWLPDNVAFIINIILIVMNILLIKSMLSWGVFYTVGWLIGSFIFLEFGMLETWDIFLYIILPIAVIAVRLILAIKRGVTT
jgi:hypothetical protein